MDFRTYAVPARVCIHLWIRPYVGVRERVFAEAYRKRVRCSAEEMSSGQSSDDHLVESHRSPTAESKVCAHGQH